MSAGTDTTVEKISTQAVKRRSVLGVVVISSDESFFSTIGRVFYDIVGDKVALNAAPPPEAQTEEAEEDAVYEETRRTAVAFLEQQKNPIDIITVQAPSFAAALEKLQVLNEAWSVEHELVVGMLLIDQMTIDDPLAEQNPFDREIDLFFRKLGELGIDWVRSAYSIIVYTAYVPFRSGGVYSPPTRYNYRVKQKRTSSMKADLLSCFMDFLDLTFLNRRAQRGKNRENITLGQEIVSFLNHCAPKGWDCYYYTGSVVSSIIETVEKLKFDSREYCFTGPNEHSLACGAMANWMLYDRPFVIIVTSAMGDEFKGTLANLKEAKARGFIIIAELREGMWYPFQGTINPDENMQEVMKARRLPTFYLRDPEELADRMSEAFDAFSAGEGPVILYTTPQVLMSTQALAYSLTSKYPVPTTEKPLYVKDPAQLEPVIDLINNERTRIVWHCGHLDDEEFALVTEIAERAGIALVDGLGRPGSVSKYRNGKLQTNYLGSCSIYGFSARFYEYMHADGRLHPKNEQILFYLKSKISQVNTPFSEGTLKNKIRIGQVTNTEYHVAPFTDMPCIMDLKYFLQAVRARLQVNPDVLHFRKQTLEDQPFRTGDRISKIRTIPMHPNYFFRELNLVVEDLIQKENYDYTGVYDVGRNGISAYRNVARTRPAFSGWYGRALMGDALLSLNALAVTCPTNIMAFIGDGSKAIVPDVRASMVENILHRQLDYKKNVTIFYMVNGYVALINTYQERVLSHRARRQMRCLTLLEPDREIRVGPLKVVQKTLDDFDHDYIRKAITAPGQLNFFYVIVNHNNVGDGLSLITTTAWQEIKP